MSPPKKISLAKCPRAKDIPMAKCLWVSVYFTKKKVEDGDVSQVNNLLGCVQSMRF
jgi:hypothetical protein